VNGVDFTDDQVQFTYLSASPEGSYRSNVVPLPAPNGTFCDLDSRNFSLCVAGTFQPQEGKQSCLPCPIGYVCPDFGMSRPQICPAGFVCDTYGLRHPRVLCPMGHYCREGTKTSDITSFLSSATAPQNGYPGRRLMINGSVGVGEQPLWSLNPSTGVVTFVPSSVNWSMIPWPFPAFGSSRPDMPPDFAIPLLAEGPIPCPSGFYCRAGVSGPEPVPKNFSTPQRCFDGFFCSRGSVSPEGAGACPSGYYCPTTLDAIVCPTGTCIIFYLVHALT
jgi:hypothetical protein